MFCTKFKHWTMLTALLILAACSSTPDVDTDYNPDYNFSTIKTYQLMSDRSAQASRVSSLVDQRIRLALENEMAARGIASAEAASANVWISYQIVTKDKTRVTSYNNQYGYTGWRRPYGYGYPMGPTEVDVRQYTEGSLIIDLIDPATKKVVWRGVTSAILQERSSEEREALIKEHVAASISQVPGLGGVSKTQ